jgi:hypothetical protein
VRDGLRVQVVTPLSHGGSSPRARTSSSRLILDAADGKSVRTLGETPGTLLRRSEIAASGDCRANTPGAGGV